MSRCASRQVVAVAVVMLCSPLCGWWSLAGASDIEYSALDQISMSYEVPITNASDHVTLPSVVLVTSATLDTNKPGDSAIHAPKGMIYLSLQATSGSVQTNYGDANWGHFFANMTPLPASALSYVTASDQSYPVTRINPVDQTNNANAGPDDGLLDATYYFTVPITNRTGTIVIAPCRTIGVEYQTYTGGSATQMNVGGPTKIAVVFPKKLTVTLPTPTTTVPPPGTTFAKGVNWIGTLFAGLLTLFIFARLRRSGRLRPLATRPPTQQVRRPSTAPTASTVVPDSENRATHVPPVTATATTAATPTSAKTGVDSILRVDVLGPLTFTPVSGPLSDPVRAIVAFLAMNNERVLALEEIQNAIWPLTANGTDITRASMRNYIVDARKAVGEYHLPTASGRPGYQLVHFDTDWSEMQRLIARAKDATKSEGLILRRQALGLARGLPFCADTTRYFTWTFTSSVVYKIVQTTTTLTHGVATDLVLASDLEGAQEALALGMLVDPASLTLWEDLTDVLLETDDQSLLALHWRAADAVLRVEDVVQLRSREHG
jgi:DNA-binding SARP family transcriptional activator